MKLQDSFVHNSPTFAPSWATSIQLTSSQLTSRSILILSSHLHPRAHTKINKDVQKCFIPCSRCYVGENEHFRNPLMNSANIQCGYLRFQTLLTNSTRESKQVIAYPRIALTEELSRARAADTTFKALPSFLLVSLSQLRDSTLNYWWMLPLMSSATHYSSPPNQWQLHRPNHWHRHMY